MPDYDERIRRLEVSIAELQNFVRTSRSSPTESLHSGPRRVGGTGQPEARQDPWDTVQTILARISQEVEAIKSDITNERDRSEGLTALETAIRGDRPQIESYSPTIEATHDNNDIPLHYDRPGPSSPALGDDPTLERDSDLSNHSTEQSRTPSTVLSPFTPLSDAELGTAPTATSNRHFTLKADQLGEGLMNFILQFLEDPDFKGKISIKNLPEIDWDEFRAAMPLDEADYTTVEYKAGPTGKGYAHLHVGLTKTKPSWPEPCRDASDLTTSEIASRFEDAINDVEDHAITYYGGPPPLGFCDGLLHPGALSKLRHLPFINSTYLHLGEKGSATAMHCEDWDFWSLNLTLWGRKLWLVVAEESTAMFESFVKQNWPECPLDHDHRICISCDQFVRHRCLLLTPTRLREEGIKFDLICTRAGDLMVTRPKSYHMVLNDTASCAVSINSLPLGTVITRRLPACPLCGLHALAREAGSNVIDVELEIKSRTDDSEISKAPGNSKCTRGGKKTPAKRKRFGDDALSERPAKVRTRAEQEIEQAIKEVMAADPKCKMPILNWCQLPPPRIFKIAASLLSRAAIRQFVNLVQVWRDWDPSGATSSEAQDPASRLRQRLRNLGRAIDHSALGKFVVRLHQLRLEEEIDASKAGQLRVSPEVLDKICQQEHWTKVALQGQRKRGSAWRRLCQSHDGLLCFLFASGENPFLIKSKDYIALTGAEVELIHGLIESPRISIICHAGKAFQDAVELGGDVRFAWEGMSVDWDSLSEEEVLRCISPVA